MSEELVSALLDGECDDHEIERALVAFERDEAARTGFSRMQYVRDASRDVAAAFDPSFADRVMLAIGDEVPDGGHGLSDGLSGGVSGNVVPLRRRRPVWVQASGFAVAASVVAAVVVGVVVNGPELGEVQFASQNDDSYVAPVTRSAPTAVGNGATVQTVQTVATVPQTSPAMTRQATQLRWAQIEDDQARQLNNYLIDYSNYRSVQGVGGTLGYARFAAHTADYRPQED